jgi:WD40 repeat protein
MEDLNEFQGQEQEPGEDIPEPAENSTRSQMEAGEAVNADTLHQSALNDEIARLKNEKLASLKEIGPQVIKLAHNFGFPSHKRNNVHFIAPNRVVSVVGNLIMFLDVRNGETKYVPGIRDGSLGAIAVHPRKTCFAVGEIAESSPNIYIYSYPEVKIIRILANGSTKGYSDLCFDPSGTKIASIGIEPDYLLTVWDWDKSQVMNRSKAFSQDVYRVAFSPDMEGILTTSGMGHIKFWRLSHTFTGLKLQGSLGKFGASELSDIESFIQLPNGKVLSSTETGNLLIWDGGFIKCEIAVKGKRPCHLGRIEIILLQDGEVITGGEDGFFRIWDLETIDNADVATTSGENTTSAAVPRVFELEPLDEILIAKEVKVLGCLL